MYFVRAKFKGNGKKAHIHEFLSSYIYCVQFNQRH